MLILMATGTVFVISAGTSLSYQLDWARLYTHPGLRQLAFLPLAILTMFAVSRFDHRHLSFARGPWRSLTLYLLVLSTALLAVALMIGTERGGAQRWIFLTVGPLNVSFQPSELAKWAAIFFCAAICAHWDFQFQSYWRQFVPICLVLGLVVALIVLEDFGTAALVALLTFTMLMVGGAKWWHLLSPLPIAITGFVWALFQAPHRLRRLAAFLHPEEWSDTVAYQANQSLIALGSGGIWGKGLGGGICKYGHLPADTTDFVFAIIGEELGFIGCAGVILLFIVFVFLGMQVVARCKEDFSRLLATGIILALAIQAALNIGVVTVVLPTKGIPLPFISRGGTSLLLSAAAVGILLNIARQVDRDATQESLPQE
ncbi:FtsW/RodA/SpoVE family cell cycle protein [Planctomycetota bacterium]